MGSTGVSEGKASSSDYGVSALGLGLTEGLADFVSTLEFADLPLAVVHQAKRAFVDWFGCAIAGSHHPTIDRVAGAMQALGEIGDVPVIARRGQFTKLAAATINGQSGHVLDFDDTHMGGVILHASSPILGALVPAAYGQSISGKKFLTSFVAGFEASVRLGQAASSHHEGGWHLTGTLGTVGAACACARLMDLSPEQTTAAIGIAATQAAGMQQNRGTSCKSFHAGKAASNGLLSAVLAAQGFTASTESLEGQKGFIRIYSVSQEPGRLIAGLRERWEILSNGYKPYACGVVLHPAIDAMLELASQISAESNYWRQVDRVSLRVNPAAIRITGVQQPANGLMSKFSISHAAAVSFVDGSGGLAQFSDTSICRGEIVEFSKKITVLSDDSLDRDQAAAECWLGDGRSIKSHIVHARGTVKNPLDDRQLFNKFFENIGAKKNEKYAEAHIDQLMKAEAIDDISPLFVWPT